MVEGAKRQKDAERNRAQHSAGRADDHLPAGDGDAATLLDLCGQWRWSGLPITVTVLVALLVCLIRRPSAGLLSAIGIAGMVRMIQANVIAVSGRAG